MLINDKRLLRDIESIEQLQSELAEATGPYKEQIKGIFDGLKNAGFAVKSVRHLIRERALKDQERSVLDLYRAALGPFADTELGKAAEPKSDDAEEGEARAKLRVVG